MRRQVTRWWLLPTLLSTLFALASLASAGQIVRVTDVLDGDTIILEDGRRVRYLGINSPEHGERLHDEAKELNRSLVMGKGIRLELEGGRETDAYGRLLAYVYVGDTMANARLIEEGMAHAFFIGPEGRHNAMLLKLQTDAKQRGVGIWAGSGRTKALKITSVHPVDPAGSALGSSSYSRISSLSDGAVQLAGYVLSDEGNHRYTFPEVRLEPGYTVIVSGKADKDRSDNGGQLIIYWPEQGSVWNPAGGTAHLMDPSGKTIDIFSYPGIRHTASPGKAQGKIIGNRSSMIYHLPGQLNYDRVKEKNRMYFDTEDEAVRAGYRRAKR